MESLILLLAPKTTESCILLNDSNSHLIYKSADVLWQTFEDSFERSGRILLNSDSNSIGKNCQVNHCRC